MSTQGYAYYHRDFLNSLEHGGKALVECYVNKLHYGLSASLTIGDCGRHINLEFSAGDEASLEHMRAKILRLQGVIAAMAATLESQVPAVRIVWEEDKKKREEYNNKPQPGLVGTGVFRDVVAQAQPGSGVVHGTTVPEPMRRPRRRPHPSRIGTRRRAH